LMAHTSKGATFGSPVNRELQPTSCRPLPGKSPCKKPSARIFSHRSDIGSICRKECQEEDSLHHGQLYQTAGAHSRRRLSGSSFGIGGLEGVEHGGCLNDPLYGLLNSLFYPFERGLEYSDGSVRMATDGKSASVLEIALRWASSARPLKQGTEEHCAA